MSRSPESAEEVAQRIEGFIVQFREEKWADERRKLDVLLGLRLAMRIARGEVPTLEDGA